jgi:hypothetical protein
MAIPKRVVERIQSKLKAFQAVLQAQRARDVSEADTVTIIKDVLSEMLGFDKYAELTSEHSIRGTFCDLAVQFDGKVQLLIEVKAIGLDLKENHVKQAIDYAANQGVEWVVLTNSIQWVLYHVLFRKPIDKVEVAKINLLEASARAEADIERLYLLTREGLSKNALSEYRDRQDATSRFMLAAILLNSEPVASAIRKEVRRVSDLLVDAEVIEKMLREQVIKREAIEGDQADAAVRRFKAGERAAKKRADPAEPASAAPAAAPLPALPPVDVSAS